MKSLVEPLIPSLIRPKARQVVRRILHLYWRFRDCLGRPAKNPAEILSRLDFLARTMPRKTRGTFCFPFGPLEYVDAMALRYQYEEIFVQRGYDFITTREDPLILDCGGHIGLGVVRFKQQYPRCRVIVFEADPNIAPALLRNLQTLGLNDVQFVQAAVWNKRGSVRFTSDRADASRVTDDGAQQVEAVRLADMISETVDFLKLDIEGAEYPVLLDLCESGKIRHVNHLAIELHGREHDQRHVPNLLEALKSHDFLFTFTHARVAPDLPGGAEPTPFPGLPDAKFLLRLYGWRRSSWLSCMS